MRQVRSSSSPASLPAGFDLYLRELAPLAPLSRATEQALATRATAGELAARDLLVLHNLRFVVKVAKKYRGLGVSIDDLVAEGNLGLLRAVDRFDATAGVRLISYAVWWIRQAILLALATQGRVLTLPASRASDLYKLRKAEQTLTAVLGRAPTPDELAMVSDLGVDAILGMRAAHDAGALELDGTVVDDTSVSAEDHRRLSEDGDAILTERLDAHHLTSVLARALQTLPARDATVLTLYYGLDGQLPHTLEQIAASLDLTRERVRQLRNRALERMQAVPTLRVFAPESCGAPERDDIVA